MASVKTLMRIRECDTEILRLRRQIDELPQAAQIVECRAKRKELKGKQDQTVELSDEVESKLAAFQREEESIIKKLNDLQATLDSTHDYRVTQSVTRDMQGLVKRQGTLVEESDALLERQIKIDKLYNQIAGMLKDLDHKEEHLVEEFKKAGGALKQQVDKLASEREGLLGQLDELLKARYEKLRQEKAGVGIAVLEGATCSACRSEIMEGQLRRLQAGPALGECPNCHRLLIVREDEED